MGSYNTAVITTVGQALLTSVLGAQGTMTFTKLQTSSYSYASGTDLSALTSLNNVEQEVNVGSATIVDSTHISASATISNSGISTEYNVNTLGIFASDGVNEVLFAVSTAVTPDVIPVDQGGTPSTYKYKFTLAVSSTSDITISAVGDFTANDISYSNTTSGLPATEVQTAIDVIDAEVDGIVNVYGSKNLLPYPYNETTKTENGITFTDNGDGTVTVSPGTATDTAMFFLHSVDETLTWSNVVISGCPEGGLSGGFSISVRENGYWNDGDRGDGYAPAGVISALAITIVRGVTITEPLTFKPMIRDARITDSTWVPYAKTNRELTTTSATQSELSNLVLTGTTNTSDATIARGTCFVLNGDFVVAKADIANGATFTLNTNYEKKSVGSILTELNSNLSVTTLNITPSTGELKVVKTGHIVNVLWGTGGTSQIIPLGVTALASGLPIPINMYPREQGSIPASSILVVGINALFDNSFSVFVTNTGDLKIMNGSNSTSIGAHRGVNITYVTNE